MRGTKVFKYELRNIGRSRWIFAWSILLFLLTLSFIKISGDFDKAVLALFSVLTVAMPLIAMLFSAVYWYYSDRFTQLLLTMPLQRSGFFWARWSALVLALCISLACGLFPAFALYGGIGSGVFVAYALCVFLTVVFVTLGLLTAIVCGDRMKGIGTVLALWLYFVMVHDGLLLVLLVLMKEYPLDLMSAIVAALNPLGLVRVSLVLYFDAPLLLSQSGALVRQLVTSPSAALFGVLIATCWIVIPAFVAQYRFRRADF